LLIVLAKHKRIVLGIPFVAAVSAAIISLLLPNIYTGTTKILPPQQSASRLLRCSTSSGVPSEDSWAPPAGRRSA